jgi:hypothetical protein
LRSIPGIRLLIATALVPSSVMSRVSALPATWPATWALPRGTKSGKWDARMRAVDPVMASSMDSP